MIIKLT